MSETEEQNDMYEDQEGQICISESESESSSEDESQEIVIPPKKEKTSKKKLGVIEKDENGVTVKPKKYAQRKPMTAERKEALLLNLKKAREVRSALCAKRKQLELQKQLSKYEIQDASSDDNDDEEEVVLTKRKVIQEKAKSPKKEAHKLPKKKKSEAPVVIPDLDKVKKRKEQEDRLKLLEKIVSDQVKEKKKDKRKQTIINIQQPQAPVQPKIDMKKFLDLGL